MKLYLRNNTLPGKDAHIKMMPEGREYIKHPQDAKESAVCLIFFKKEKKDFFILTKRAKSLEHHSGQISLPGGTYDFSDKNLWETAKRETYEEIGIYLKNENLIGQLTPIYINISNFSVTPFIVFFEQIPNIKINNKEVEEIFFVDFKSFFSKTNYNLYYDKLGKKIPYYKLQKEKVWGATAMILSEFYEITKKLKET